jgi:hypothetical protein
MGAIIVGLRPCDDERLRRLAEAKGCRPQDLAGIYLERAIRRAGALPARPATHDHRPSVAVEPDKSYAPESVFRQVDPTRGAVEARHEAPQP